MSQAIASHAKIESCGCAEPGPETPVLLHRDLLPGTDLAALPVFGDERWDLTHGIFEAHTQVCSVIFTDCPDAFRAAIKRYIWELINHPAPQQIRSAGTDRLALRSVQMAFRKLLPFLTWLDAHDITSFDQVTNADLDHFLDDLIASESSHRTKATQLIEVRRLWCYRERLPEFMRLPAAPPWDGDDTRDLLDTPRADRENATPRIHPDTLQPLLMWSLRFVEDFADDIIAAFATYQHLQQRDRPFRRKSNDPVEVTIKAGRRGWLHPFVTAWITQQRDQGGALPGRQLPDGTWDVHWRHLSRVFSCSESAWEPTSRDRRLILESGLSIADDAYLDTPITGHLHGRPWHSGPISYTEAPRLARMLVTACAVTIIYLSGMRPGELVNLERGCVEHDPVGDFWLLRGQQWKGAVGPDGQKLPQGAPRQDPWTVIPPVVRAVEVLERLHPHQLLFPVQLRAKGRIRGPERGTPLAQASRLQNVTDAVSSFIDWINQHCAEHGYQDEQVPADPAGPVSLSRFRRTLAWHIVRRPRGLVAGAIQYGHLHVRITLGYAGTYNSGFPDDYAFEDWLHRLEQLADRHEQLAAGEHVSGPAADLYRHRVATGHDTFAGRVLTSNRQALDLLDNPLLQIFPGNAMTCVFDAKQALCQIRSAEGDIRRTPDQDDCRPQCRNLAYTDKNIAQLQGRAHHLHELVEDRLAPSIRRARERQELNRINDIIRRHHRR